MFSAWNLGDWLASVGAALLMFGMFAALGLLVRYVTIVVWGEESEAPGKAGLGEAKTDTEPSTRRAA